MTNRSEIQALIKLIDDPDEAIFTHIKTKLLELGPPVIDELESAWENSLNPFLQERIEEIIADIQFDTLINKLKIWRRKNSNDLIQGATLLAKFQYPDLDTAPIKEQIETIRQAIWLELQETMTPLEKVNTFNHVFYQLLGFGKNLKNVFNPQNNFIHIALERKKGSPIMLGIIYMSIAQSLKLPIYGIDLPYHFALAFCKYNYSPSQTKSLSNKNILFYINPISRGVIFSRNEIKDYLKRMNIEVEQKYFEPVTNERVILALFQQLKLCYTKNNDHEKAEELEQLLNIFYED